MRLLRILGSIAATALVWASSLYWVIRLPGMEAASYAAQDTAAWRTIRQAATALRQAAGAHGPETDDMLFTDLYTGSCLLCAIALVWVANCVVSRAVHTRRQRANRVAA